MALRTRSDSLTGSTYWSPTRCTRSTNSSRSEGGRSPRAFRSMATPMASPAAMPMVTAKYNAARVESLIGKVFVSASDQPWYRVSRLTLRTDLEVQAGPALATAFPGRGERIASVHPVARLTVERIGMGIQAHVAATMIDNC